ncbi:hypothetical protein DIPPA_19185 [Diplonema papillatum]|nr:hypothetical protein DIPPA_19185 [Diplonema papillatum]
MDPSPPPPVTGGTNAPAASPAEAAGVRALAGSTGAQRVPHGGSDDAPRAAPGADSSASAPLFDSAAESDSLAVDASGSMNAEAVDATLRVNESQEDQATPASNSAANAHEDSMPPPPPRNKRHAVQDDDDDDDEDAASQPPAPGAVDPALPLPEAPPAAPAPAQEEPANPAGAAALPLDDDADSVDRDVKEEVGDFQFQEDNPEPEEEEAVTWNDIFGDTFDEWQFEARDVPAAEVERTSVEVKRKIDKHEDTLNFDKDLRSIFGDAELAAEALLDLQPTETVAGLPPVHNVNVLSVPDGKKMNTHARSNRYWAHGGGPQTFLTTLPVLDNYQCLHMPLTGPTEDRRIKVSGNPEVLQDRKPILAGLQGAGQTYPGAIYTPENVVRWRKRRGKLQSNARLLRYDNGDTVMRVGGDYFVVETQDAVQENQHLMGIHGACLVQYSKIRQRWRLRPLREVHTTKNSTLSEKERKEAEKTLPGPPEKRVLQYVPPTKTEDEIELEREARYQKLGIRHVPSEHDVDEVASMPASEDDVAGFDTMELDVVDEHEEASKRALLAQQEEAEPIREVKRRKV